jgi:hypothetical protein
MGNNNLYLWSPDYVKYDYIDAVSRDIYTINPTYYELLKAEMYKDIDAGIIDGTAHEVSETFEFLKQIELCNRKKGVIDNLVIAAEMWPYGIKLLSDGEPKEHWVTVESFWEYPHHWEIKRIKLIGVRANKQFARSENKKPFVESLLEFAGTVEYYDQDFFSIEIFTENNEILRRVTNKFSSIKGNTGVA